MQAETAELKFKSSSFGGKQPQVHKRRKVETNWEKQDALGNRTFQTLIIANMT